MKLDLKRQEFLASQREALGRALVDEKAKTQVSTYVLDKTFGVPYPAQKALEAGTQNYTINTLLSYINAIDCELIIRPKNK